MRHLGYTSCPADPDLWYKEVKQPVTGVLYYSYILIYVQMSNGVYAWGMSPAKYIKEAVSNCEKHLKTNYAGRYAMPTQAANPFVMGYEPEIDETPTLNPDQASYFQSIIGAM
jgi:hypothetical protein